MNEKEYKELIEREKGQPIRSRVFRHKITGEYETQIPIFNLNEYEEVM